MLAERSPRPTYAETPEEHQDPWNEETLATLARHIFPTLQELDYQEASFRVDICPNTFDCSAAKDYECFFGDNEIVHLIVAFKSRTELEKNTIDEKLLKSSNIWGEDNPTLGIDIEPVHFPLQINDETTINSLEEYLTFKGLNSAEYTQFLG